MFGKVNELVNGKKTGAHSCPLYTRKTTYHYHPGSANVVVIGVFARPPAPLPGMCRGYVVWRHSTTTYTSVCAGKEDYMSFEPPSASLLSGTRAGSGVGVGV